MQASEKPAQKLTFLDFGSNTLIFGASVLGQKRGIFVLVEDEITKYNSAMNTNAIIQDRAPQETTRSRRIGFLVFPGCEIVDVCGPFDAFYYAD